MTLILYHPAKSVSFPKENGFISFLGAQSTPGLIVEIIGYQPCRIIFVQFHGPGIEREVTPTKSKLQECVSISNAMGRTPQE